ncbi:glycogen synthase GlgA [Guyparkeria sp.]|uniref:glycogen synthase GlgA n=1 Tax=Guyparkeria sp. TaxID=2035736 RepID=UPI0039710FEF
MSLSVLFATSEAYPLIKTGGLADVSGALPAALADLGVDVRLVLPRYGDLVLREDQTTEHVARLDVLGQPVDILQTVMPDSGVHTYLVDHPTFSARQGNPYMGPDGNSWHDNPDRFALFARAAVAVATGEVDPDWRPDVVHANDWQTGLIPALLHEAEKPHTVFTLHNLAYQGVFDRSTFERLGLPWSLWRPDGLEFWGNMSFIKGGIVFADRITTVSPNYAREIQTAEFGYGLDGLLRHRSDALVGILNGIGSDWNPESDPALDTPYSRDELDGKAINKAALQKELGLPIREEIPLIVHVGRLVEQKGIDLLIQALSMLGQRDVQFACLGSGERRFEQALRARAEADPERIAVRIGYDEGLAHRLEGGGDAFIMPSRFEPCGLNQLYSLKYGTVPIVHSVGGLADTVTPVTPATLRDGSATGIVMNQVDVTSILWSLDEFTALFKRPDNLRQVRQQAMIQEYDWGASARSYLELYRAISNAETK